MSGFALRKRPDGRGMESDRTAYPGAHFLKVRTKAIFQFSDVCLFHTDNPAISLRPVKARIEGFDRVSALPPPHAMYWPPLAVSVEPVMNPASSPARNTTQRATSSGSPNRPTGMSGMTLVFKTSSGTAMTISVAM